MHAVSRRSSLWRQLLVAGSVFGLVVAMALLVVSAPATAATGHTGTAGCTMSVSPSAGPVGTRVTISGSTLGCGNHYGSDGGYLIFQAEHAAVQIPGMATFIPADGTFSYLFTIPASMPSGTPAAAAQSLNGGGPVAPGPTDFAVFMGAPLPIVTFDVTAAPPGWADYVAITAPGSNCTACIGGSAGYDLFRSDGYLATFGTSPNASGNAGTLPLAAPITAAAFTEDGGGYWMAARDGGVFTFGNAPYEGSLPGDHIALDDIVGIAATPSGHGYWLLGRDGGVFAFGDAPFEGSGRDATLT